MYNFFCTFAHGIKKTSMKPSLQNRLYSIDRGIRTIVGITAVIALLLMLVATLDTPIKQMLTYAFYGVGGLFAAMVLCRICLSPFVKSDEQEEFEQKIDYVLLQREKDKRQIPSVSSDYSPLRNLSEKQEEKIKSVLRLLPVHSQKPDYINMAIVAQYLTAMEKLGIADLKDKHQLRLWVARVTEKQVPSASQFNEAIPSQTAAKVTAACRELETLLSQFK